MSAEDLGKIKGGSIQDFATWFERKYGRARVEHAIDVIGEEGRAYIVADKPGLGMSPSTWYPAHIIHVALDAVTEGMSQEEKDSIADEGGQTTVRSQMRSAQGIVFALFMSPVRYGKFVQKFWRLNYDTGIVEHVELAPNRHQTRITDWKGHHPLLCRLNSAVKVTLYESIGCSDVVVEERHCITHGDPCCGSILRWAQ